MQATKKTRFSLSWVYEMCILAILSHGDSYRYEIARSDNLCMNESTLYPILCRLEKAGSLESYSQQHDFKLSRFYKMTAVGEDHLTHYKEQWKEYQKRVNDILSGRL